MTAVVVMTPLCKCGGCEATDWQPNGKTSTNGEGIHFTGWECRQCGHATVLRTPCAVCGALEMQANGRCRECDKARSED